MLHLYRKIIPAIFLFLLPATLFAQLSPGNSTASPMGNTGAAFVGGYQALGINPARLVMFEHSSRNQRLTIDLAQFAVSLNSNSLNLNLYNQIFNPDAAGKGKFLTESDKTDILNQLQDNTTVLTENNLALFGITYIAPENIGAFGFTINDLAGGAGGISKDYIVLLLRGNESFLGKETDITDTKGSLWWYRSYALSYARRIPVQERLKNVSVGISLRLIHAYGYAALDENNTSLYTSATGDTLSGRVAYRLRSASTGFFQNSNENFSLFPAPAGTGFGIDLGASMDVAAGVTLALAINDIGSVNLSENATIRERNGSTVFTGFNDILGDERINAQADSLQRILDESVRNESFSAALPTHLRLGAAFDFMKAYDNAPVVLTLDYVQGFNEEFLNSTTPLVGIGAEWRPAVTIPLRTGLRVGGREGFGWSFGFGFDSPNFSFDLHSRNLVGLFGGSASSTFSLGLGMRLRFIDAEPGGFDR